MAIAINKPSDKNESILALIYEKDIEKFSNRLPYEYRSLFLALYYYDHTVETIIETHGIAESEIRKNIAKAEEILLSAQPEELITSRKTENKKGKDQIKSIIRTTFDNNMKKYMAFFRKLRSSQFSTAYKAICGKSEQHYFIVKVSKYFGEECEIKKDIYPNEKIDEIIKKAAISKAIPEQEIIKKKPEWKFENNLNKKLFPQERLLPIPEYNKYFISNYGRIWKECTKGMQLLYTNYCKSFNKHYVGIMIARKRHTILLHRTVAIMFVPNPKNYPDVLFKNGNNEDCRAKNLYWGHQEANIPTWNINTVQKGETSNLNYKLKEADVLDIFHSKEKNKELALKYGISLVMVSSIKNGTRWGWLTVEGVSYKRKRLTKDKNP